MQIHVLDLDGSIPRQIDVLRRCHPLILDSRIWGPSIRMGCSFRRFRRFEQALQLVDPATAENPRMTFYGSGDFHHVSLILLRRLTSPFNLLILDNHPDWMRAVPLMHCGTWVYHAARLPLLQHIFHVGGDVDFDNSYRWLAPWELLQTGRIKVLPALRRFRRGRWPGIPHDPLRPEPQQRVTAQRLEELLCPFRDQLAAHPLYVSVDKDVMVAADAVVNWDSGHLDLEEVQAILGAFVRAAQGRLAGMDLIGDWSPVHLQGVTRRFFHLTEHPSLKVDLGAASLRNERTNLALLESAGVLK